MAVALYYAWDRLGRPLEPAQPVREFVEKMRLAYPRAAAANQFSWYANESHYTAEPPQDHTPFSETGWPLVSPRWVVFATDVMHRPDLGVDCFALFAYWLAEAKAGRMPWLKYMIWRAKRYDVRNRWAPADASDHFDHVHLSSRTDHQHTSLGSWSPAPGGAMTEQNQYNADAYGYAVSQLNPTAKVFATPTPPGVISITVPLTAMLTRFETKLDGLTAAVAEIGTSTPEVAAILAGMQTKLDAQQAELERAIEAAGQEARDAVGDLAEGGAAQVRADVDPPA